MRIRFLEVAQRELDEAIEYHNAEVPGLGKAFLVEALAALERIRHFPNGWASLIRKYTPLPPAAFSLWACLCRG